MISVFWSYNPWHCKHTYPFSKIFHLFAFGLFGIFYVLCNFYFILCPLQGLFLPSQSIYFCWFSCPVALTRTSNMMLNNSDESKKNISPVLNLIGKAFSLSQRSAMSTLGFFGSNSLPSCESFSLVLFLWECLFWIGMNFVKFLFLMKLIC